MGVVPDWPPVVEEYWVKPLQAKYPGTKAFLEPGFSADQLTRMRTGKGTPKHHLFNLNGNVILQAIQEDLVMKLDRTKVPNLADIHPEFIIGDDMGVGLGVTAMAIMYHTKIAPPTSWADLWKPEFKNQISVPSLRSTNGIAFFVMAGAIKSGKPPLEAQRDVDACFAGIADLKPNIYNFWTSLATVHSELVLGQPLLVLAANSKFVFPEQQKGSPIGFAVPKEGAVTLLDGAVIPKNAPDVDAAMELMNVTLSAAAQSGFAKDRFVVPTNTKATLPPEVAKVVPSKPDEMRRQLINLDWDWINSQRDVWQERWNKEVAG